MSPEPPSLRPIPPESVRIDAVRPIPRTVHSDPRGFLLETLRKDDRSVQGDRFALTYISVTVPGEFRDRDRWHVHKIQTDRFVVAAGEMILALYDGRPGSPTRGRIEALRMEGAPFGQLASPAKREIITYLVPIPPGVYHCIGNLSEDPFVLLNSPTELYDPADEGRVPFTEVPIGELSGPFTWDRVDGDRSRP
jgi:dTDP-4-dehydrorhamnose 3,5-epimerase